MKVLRVLSIVLLAGGVAVSAWAQDSQPKREPASGTKQVDRKAGGPRVNTPVVVNNDGPGGTVTNPISSGDGAKVSLNFEGGSLSNFVQAVRKAAAPEPFNAIVNGDGAEPVLPPIDLRGVTLGTLATAAARSAMGTELSVIRDEDGTAAYVFRYFPPRLAGTDRHTDVLSLRELFEARPTDPDGVAVTLTPSTVLSAVENAASMGDEPLVAPANIKYHEESALLFIRGTEDQIRAVRTAINLMQNDVAGRRTVFDTGKLRRMETDLAKNQVEISYLVDQVKAAEEELSAVQQRIDSGAASTAEAAPVKEKYLHLRSQLEKAKLEQNQVEAEVKVLRAMGERAGGKVPGDPLLGGSKPDTKPVFKPGKTPAGK